MRMAPVVMSFDVVKVGRILERLVVPVEVLHPTVDFWVAVTDGRLVALKVTDVDRVEADLCE